LYGTNAQGPASYSRYGSVVSDERRPWERAIPVAVALVGLAWGTIQAFGVGDPDATGIVEDGLGGPGTGAVLMAFFVGIPALIVGAFDGLAARLRRRGVRLLVRILLVGGLGFWAGLWVWGFTDIDCDGSCIDPQEGLIWAALAVAVGCLVLEWVLATLVARLTMRRRAE
jgi:hypothetical protein